MDSSYDEIKQTLLDRALNHVPFDGWSQASFQAAISESGVDSTMAAAVCPRGAIDLAIAFHKRGDDMMRAHLENADLGEMRFRDRIAYAVRFRLELIGDKETVRRGSTLFSLPHLCADGTKLIWCTADAIWLALGDQSDDINWYSKRSTLSAVYSATVLYWLGDNSEDHADTWAFLDRRIDNVMQIEGLKSKIRQSNFLSTIFSGPQRILEQIKAPQSQGKSEFPGHWEEKK